MAASLNAQTGWGRSRLAARPARRRPGKRSHVNGLDETSARGRSREWSASASPASATSDVPPGSASFRNDAQSAKKPAMPRLPRRRRRHGWRVDQKRVGSSTTGTAADQLHVEGAAQLWCGNSASVGATGALLASISGALRACGRQRLNVVGRDGSSASTAMYRCRRGQQGASGAPDALGPAISS